MFDKILEGTGVLYHVTPSENIIGIDAEGIDPLRAKGKLKASWYVRKNEIQWAILHVSLKYNVSVLNIAICTVLIDWREMKRTCQQGRYYTYKTYHPENFTPATYFVEN